MQRLLEVQPGVDTTQPCSGIVDVAAGASFRPFLSMSTGYNVFATEEVP